jgi:hypothetical protein
MGLPTDPNAALIAAIYALSAQIAAWNPGGGTPSCIPSFGQAVQFVSVDLTVARTEQIFDFAACYNYCVVFCDGSAEGISIKERDQSGHSVDLGHYRGFPLQDDTTRIFLTNDVRAGRSLLVLGFTRGEPLHLTEQKQIISSEVYNLDILAAGTFYSLWYNFANGKLLIDVVSTLDQACTIQLVGNIVADFTTAKNIGAPLNCPIGSVITSGLDIGLAPDDWHPYIGVVITTAVAPTLGNLTIKAVQLSE